MAEYDFIGLGSEYPKQRARSRSSVNTSLEEMFDDWLTSTTHRVTDNYAAAVELLEASGNISVAHVHSLLIEYEHHKKIKHAGAFLSAVYNEHCSDLFIEYDLNIPVDYLGHELPPEKVLVNTTKVGSFFGNRAQGLVINRSQSEDYMGQGARGAIFNFRETGSHFMHKGIGLGVTMGPTKGSCALSASGPVIAFGVRPTTWTSSRKYTINKSRVPEFSGLGEYLTKLSLELLISPDKAIDTYGERPARAIRRKIRRILGPGWSGHKPDQVSNDKNIGNEPEEEWIGEISGF